MGIFSKRKGARKSKSLGKRYEQLTRLFGHSRGQTNNLSDRIAEEINQRENVIAEEVEQRREEIAKEWRRSLDELERSYSRWEGEMKERIKDAESGRDAALTQQTYLQTALRSKDSDLRDLRNGAGLVPFLRVLERYQHPFEKAITVYLDTGGNLLYASAGFLDIFGLDSQSKLSQIPYSGKNLKNRLGDDSVLEVQLGENKFKLKSLGVNDVDGNPLGIYIQFHPQNPIGKLRDKLRGVNDVTRILEEMLSKLPVNYRVES